jgi:hypothetical protein
MDMAAAIGQQFLAHDLVDLQIFTGGYDMVDNVFGMMP